MGEIKSPELSTVQTVGRPIAKPESVALALFEPLAPDYERWARVLSLAQDGRWRQQLVAGMAVRPGSLILDVAAGTGSITRLLSSRGARVVSLDQSVPMLRRAVGHAATGVLGTAMSLPFGSSVFDGLTFGYLLRYVSDVVGTMTELARVVRSGGRIGMLEFGRPEGLTGAGWTLYTRIGLPAAGAIIGNGWDRVGSFLGKSIEEFHAQYPETLLTKIWQEAGMANVQVRHMSLGGGLLMWGTKR